MRQRNGEPNDSQLRAVRQTIHDLGNSAHLVSMAATIMAKNTDPENCQAVQEMLSEASTELAAGLSTLRELLLNSNGNR